MTLDSRAIALQGVGYASRVLALQGFYPVTPAVVTTFEEDLVAHLLADSGVTALVGGRVWPLMRPAGGQLPALTYQRIAGVPLNDLAGDRSGLTRLRVQFDGWASSRLSAQQVADALGSRLKTAASTFTALNITQYDIFEDEPRLWRVVIDASFWYRTS